MNIQENFSLLKYNTFGINAIAKYFACFSSVDDLEEILHVQASEKKSENQPLLILGGGSNILFTQNYQGLVLKNEILGIEKIAEDEEMVYVKAGAGVRWHELVMYCIQNNWAGVENLSLIPGNVGASPMQNIGAYGAEIKDVFFLLNAFHIQEKKMVCFNAAECEFGYRESIFKGKYKNQFVITDVTYRLQKNATLNTSYGAIEQELKAMNISVPTLQSVSQAVINIRSSKLPNPAEIGNAGSFFKNPEIDKDQFTALKKSYPSMVGYDMHNGKFKVAAGWLIEQSGPEKGVSWKGYRKADAGCHAKQALVLVNHGHAKGEEIFLLSEAIILSVNEKFGIVLQREVNIL